MSSETESFKNYLNIYNKSNIFELYRHFYNELSEEEDKIHKDYMNMYHCFALSSNAWDYKRAKLVFKKNKEYKKILSENGAQTKKTKNLSFQDTALQEPVQLQSSFKDWSTSIDS